MLRVMMLLENGPVTNVGHLMELDLCRCLETD